MRRSDDRRNTYKAGWAAGYRNGYAEALRRVQADVLSRDRGVNVPYFDAEQDYLKHFRAEQEGQRS